MAKTLEELHIFQRAVEAADAISAILDRPAFRRDRRLRDQIAECADGIPTQISEGYGQRTDKHFSHFLGIAEESATKSERILPRRAERNTSMKSKGKPSLSDMWSSGKCLRT
jgi:four helix bundle protein